MDPKVSTRLLRPYMDAGWSELAGIYYYIQNDDGSLWNQYLCHWDFFGGITWDIYRASADELPRYCSGILQFLNKYVYKMGVIIYSLRASDKIVQVKSP